MKLATSLRVFALTLSLAAFLGFAASAFADHCGKWSHDAIASTKMTDLHCAAVTNDALEAAELIRAAADVNVHDEWHDTPLHETAGNNAAEVAALLIRAGADVNAHNAKKETPLHRAAGSNAAEVAALLIRAGANVNARNVKKETPLFRAVRSNAVEVAAELIRAGAPVTQDAIIHAIGITRMSKMFIDSGACDNIDFQSIGNSIDGDLPPEIQADRLLLRAQSNIDNEEYRKAREGLSGILFLSQKHDFELPSNFTFRLAEVMEFDEEYNYARRLVSQYLRSVGRQGANYIPALEMLERLSEHSDNLDYHAPKIQDVTIEIFLLCAKR